MYKTKAQEDVENVVEKVKKILESIGRLETINVDQVKLFCHESRNIKAMRQSFPISDEITGQSSNNLDIQKHFETNPDSEAMFGAIISIGQGKYATSVTSKHEKNSDGIGAYIDLITKYRLPYSVRSANATTIINENFHTSYHGGLPQYLLNLEEAYAKLDKVAAEKAMETQTPIDIIPDSYRLEQLRNKLLPFKDYHSLLSTAQTRGYTFLECLTYFRNSS